MDSHPSEQNLELDLAWQLVENTGVNVFLTGKAGTGKTTFLRQLITRLPKRMVVLAPTGVAAINAGGMTIHSFFQLPLSPFVPDGSFQTQNQSKYQFSKQKKNIIRTLDLLVIDEISMVRADLLDSVDDALRRLRRSDQPFGGVQLLMIGDLQQLAPVVKDDEWRMLREYYDTPYFFGSRALQKTRHVTIELQKVYRQTDETFVGLLNRVRNNCLTPADISLLNQRVGQEEHLGEGTIRLTTHNRTADTYNEGRLVRISAPIYTYRAEVQGIFPETSYPAEALLTLKLGAQVMFLKNDTSGSHAFYNGLIGQIVDIDDHHIVVRSHDDDHTIEVAPMEWTNSRYTIDKTTREIKEEVEGTFRQYPLRLAWAITIHKSQGLTFERAILDVNAAFAAGQTYVALSRCRSLQGLALTAPLSPGSVITDQLVCRYIDAELQEAQKLPEQMDGLKLEYFRGLLDELFDFRPLQWDFQKLLRIVDEHLYKIYPNLLARMKEKQPAMQSELFDVAPRFCRQLEQILAAGDEERLKQRINDACKYFEDKLVHLLFPFANEVNAISSDNKRVQEKLDEVKDTFCHGYRLKHELLIWVLNHGFTVPSYLKQKARFVLDMEMGKESKSTPKARTKKSLQEMLNGKGNEKAAGKNPNKANGQRTSATRQETGTATDIDSGSVGPSSNRREAARDAALADMRDAARRKTASTPSSSRIAPSGTDEALVPDDDIAYPELYNTLRRWRGELAYSQHKPAYAIVSNLALASITNALPTNERELSACKGMGKVTIDRYGKDILEIVRDYIAENADW